MVAEVHFSFGCRVQTPIDLHAQISRMILLAINLAVEIERHPLVAEIAAHVARNHAVKWQRFGAGVVVGINLLEVISVTGEAHAADGSGAVRVLATVCEPVSAGVSFLTIAALSGVQVLMMAVMHLLPAKDEGERRRCRIEVDDLDLRRSHHFGQRLHNRLGQP
jgi:hypothetical protein